MNYVIISATNRANSVTRKFTSYCELQWNKRLSTEDRLEIIDLTELGAEIWHPSVYAEKPASFQKFSDLILNADGILSIVPEYNGSAPGAFKYFIDMLPFPQSLNKTPCAFIGLSAGRFGAFRAVEHMQDVFQYRMALLYPQRVFISFVQQHLDQNSFEPTEELTQKLFQEMLDGFTEFSRTLKNLKK